jgi:hypothetical protein
MKGPAGIRRFRRTRQLDVPLKETASVLDLRDKIKGLLFELRSLLKQSNDARCEKRPMLRSSDCDAARLSIRLHAQTDSLTFIKRFDMAPLVGY